MHKISNLVSIINTYFFTVTKKQTVAKLNNQFLNLYFLALQHRDE